MTKLDDILLALQTERGDTGYLRGRRKKAKRDIKKHFESVMKRVAENNGMIVIDGEAYGITKVDSIKAPLGGDDE